MDSEIIKRLEKLERANRVLIAYVEDLKERIGDTLGQQTFTVQELMRRWNANEHFVRKIITARKLGVIQDENGKPKRPLAVLKSEVLRYEKSLVYEGPKHDYVGYHSPASPPEGKTARGFVPGEKYSFDTKKKRGGRRLGEF